MVKEGCVETITGKIIPIQADSICVHGDNPDAIGFTEKIRDTLIAEGVTVTCIENVISSR